MSQNLSKMVLIIGLAVLLLLILLAYLYMTRNFNYWKRKGIKEIPPVPFFGSFSDVIKQKIAPGHWFEKMYRDYAPLPYVGLYILDKRFLMIRDPEIIRQVLVKDAHNFVDKHFTANPNDVLGDANIFLIKNPRWKYLRHKLTPVYTSGKLKKMFHLMVETCTDLEVFLDSQNLEDEGLVFEMKELTANLMTDLIASTAYGIKVNSLKNPDAEFRARGRTMFNFNRYRGWEFLAMFFAPHIAKLLNVHFFNKKNVPFLRHVFWSILEERERSGIKRFDLIDLLIELRRNQPEEEKKIFDLDGDNLVAQAAVFFSGGFETSATLSSFALYELAMNPEIQDKMRKEIKTGLNAHDGKLTYDLVSSELPYLDTILMETLRLYPPLPFLDRVASNDYKIPGSDVILEKGTPIVIPTRGIHMDEKYYPEPYRFNPERFCEENNKARESGFFLTFGDGPHACMGKRYGLMQAKLAIITLLLNYEILPCKKTHIPMKQNVKAVFTTAEDGIYLKIRKLPQ